MQIYAREEHAARMAYLSEKKAAKLELLRLKKQNELSKAELLARKISRFEHSNEKDVVPSFSAIYQDL